MLEGIDYCWYDSQPKFFGHDSHQQWSH